MLARELSEEQERAVGCGGNSVIVAGPGSGKTMVLSHKISRLLTGLPQYKGVVAISYTNKASNELRDRVLVLSPDTKASFFGTIDKFYIREIVLPFTRHMLGIGVIPEATFISDSTPEWQPLIDALREAVRHLHSSKAAPEDGLPKAAVLALSNLTPQFKQGHVHLRTVGALAFLTVLGSHACRRYLKARYSHLCIDEYQDSDFEQHALFMLMTRLGFVTNAVGDLNQSIFGFADKDAQYLKELTSNPGFELRQLLDNHRCHPSIKDYSTRFLRQQVGQPGEDRRVYWQHVLGDETAACRWIERIVDQTKVKYGVRENAQIAVLGRSGNTLSRVARCLRLPTQYHVTLPIEEMNAQCAALSTQVLRIWFGDKTRIPELVDDLFDRDTPLGQWQASKFLRELRATGELFRRGESERPTEFLKQVCDQHRIPGWDDEFEQQLRGTLSHPLLPQAFAPVQPDRLQLFTLHKSKGLEFDIVIHMDLHDYILPGYGSLNQRLDARVRQRELVQDINLHYVGLTRARKAVYLVHQSLRHNGDNEQKEGIRSRFLSAELRSYAVQLPAYKPDMP